MSAETQREIGDLLAGHLDAMQEDLRQRAQPYREIRDLLDKRDRAIQRAVALEGQNAALLRDVAEARDILRDVPCDCRKLSGLSRDCGREDVDPCARCVALQLLPVTETIGGAE